MRQLNQILSYCVAYIKKIFSESSSLLSWAVISQHARNKEVQIQHIYLKLKLSVRIKISSEISGPVTHMHTVFQGMNVWFLLHVSITALLTQIEVKWPLKQLSIAPHAPSRIGCCCDCMGFYSIHCSLHTYRIIFTLLLLHPIYCSVATLVQHSGVFGYRSFQCS